VRQAYLDKTLPQWLEREPENPYVAVFAPLIIRRDEDPRACVPKVSWMIRDAPLEPPIRATLERMLDLWLIERFPLPTKEELRTMLPVLVPIEQTRVYQEIFAEGEAKGKAEGGAEGRRWMAFEALPEYVAACCFRFLDKGASPGLMQRLYTKILSGEAVNIQRIGNSTTRDPLWPRS
jgi:hypothetical protein